MIGVDYHPSFQQIAFLDQGTGFVRMSRNAIMTSWGQLASRREY